MAAYVAVSLPLPPVVSFATATFQTTLPWSTYNYTGTRLGYVRVRIWNGSAWVDAPHS